MARFLVVDKAANTVSALRSLLQDDGHEVLAFTSGQDAVQALGRDTFDAVCAELDMPHVSGHAVVRAARQLHPRACVFCMSSRPGRGIPQEACYIFEKPLDYDDLNRTFAECRARGGPGRAGICYLKTP